MATIPNRVVIEEGKDVTSIDTIGPLTGAHVRCDNTLPEPLLHLATSVEYTQDMSEGHPWVDDGSTDNMLPVWSPGDFTSWTGDTSLMTCEVNSDGTFTIATTGRLTKVPEINGNCSLPVNIPRNSYLHVQSTGGRFNVVITYVNSNLQYGQLQMAVYPYEHYALKRLVQTSVKLITRISFSFPNYDSQPSPITFSLKCYSDSRQRPVVHDCPITGATEATVRIAPTINEEVGTAYNTEFAHELYGAEYDLITGLVRERLTKVVLDSDFSGTRVATTAGYKWLVANDALPGTSGSTVAVWLISSYLTPVSAAYQDANNCYGISVDSNGNVYASFGDLSALSDVQAFLETYPLTVLYPMATPEEFYVTQIEARATGGTNYVWSDSGEVTVMYRSETIHREYLPLLDFDNDTITAIDSDTAVSIIGDELYADQFSATAIYEVFIPRALLSTELDESHLQLFSNDGHILKSRLTYDIRALPYGSRISYYVNGEIYGYFYSKDVERVGSDRYKINGQSLIGMLDTQYHEGGVYKSETFADVLYEILGDNVEYIVDATVASQKVNGWLPYDTKRNNLYQLILAYGVNIKKGANGVMQFVFLDNSNLRRIEDERVFGGGTVTYDDPASRVEIVEHAYYPPFDDTEEEVVYKTEDTLEHALVIFEKPVDPNTVKLVSNELIVPDGIESCGYNYAIMTGTGEIYAKPYLHSARTIGQDNETFVKENIVSVENATLITMLNSANVLRRLSNYYFNAITVTQDIQVEDERCGEQYEVHNAFGEAFTGFMKKMSMKVSSFKRARCEFVENYLPGDQGADYGGCDVIDLPRGASEIWQIPASAHLGNDPVLRVVLIGCGEDGLPGEDGGNAEGGSRYEPQPGAKGGTGGRGGLGGRVFITTIPLKDNMTQLTFVNEGDDSALTMPSFRYTSADGTRYAGGYYDMFSSRVYARAGKNGVDGAKGGTGGKYYYGELAEHATKGDSLEANGQTWNGGNPTMYPDKNGNLVPEIMYTGTQVGISSPMRVYYAGGGGGGAAYGEDGHDGEVGYSPYTGTDEGYMAGGGLGGRGADGLDAADAYYYTEIVDGYEVRHPLAGCGGGGGNGGGGGGGGGLVCYRNSEDGRILGAGIQAPGVGGKGGAGGKGIYGCAIVYYRTGGV